MIGDTISHYKILEKLGEGGMGVVYKASDTKLDRDVALKFLPPHLAASQQDKVRFIQEAKAASALNHPNVCTIHAIEEHEGQLFIVMEFVDGQTLRQKKETISYKQAVDIGIQIADGLAAAHEKGIVHRDIKPDNIMIRKDGIAQIMDFGLAKLRANGSKITRLTKEGSTVGTAGYMSPEQVQGHDTDHRSDIFSFGVVMYELLTGQLPFRGVHETALAYEIVHVDAAPMLTLKPDLDPGLDAIVLDCLEKDPKERCQSVAEVARDLRRVKRESTRQRHSRITAAAPAYSGMKAVSSVAENGSQSQPQHTAVKLPWIIASACVLLAIGVLAFHFLNRSPVMREVVRFAIPFPSRGYFARQSPLISPDGRKIAFVASDSAGKSSIWIRPLAAVAARPLPGTEDGAFPFWSFDSRFIAFFAGGKLKKVDANGGPVQSICDAPEGRGGSWGSAGIIVFSPSFGTGIQQVPASGGVASFVTMLDTTLKEESHRWPCFLPDGRHFLYLRRGSTEKSGIYLGSIDSKDFAFVIPSTWNAIYTAQGFLLFLRGGTLMAQPFDPAKGELHDEPAAVADELGGDIGYSLGFFSASDNGVLVMGAGTGSTTRQLFWYDRSGKRLGAIGSPGIVYDFALSPDERRIVFRRVDASAGNNHDLWIIDLSRSTESRFTFSQALDDDPVWSPDGKSIIFDSNPVGASNIYRKIATGAGREELLLKAPTGNYPLDYSSDGRYILYTQRDEEANRSNSSLWVLPLSGDRKPVPITQGEANISTGKFSPDAKWLAYASNESGREEVYVQAFPATEGKWQVSTTGGGAPQWGKDGKEIYYLSAAKKLMVVKFATAGGSVEMGIPEPLFEVGVDRFTAPNRYAVTRNGQRFVVNLPSEGAASLPLTVVMNWDEEIKKK